MSYFINLSLLRQNTNFRYLYIGQFVSFLGTMITSVALPYQVYSLTHSTLMVGLISLFQLLPLLVTALAGGVLADRKHRKKLLIMAEIILACGCLSLAVNAALHQPNLIIIFLVATFLSAINGLHRPALDSMIQQIVDKKDFPMVGSLSTFTFSVSMIAGPAVGGLLIAHFGLTVTYLIDFLSFCISLGALSLIRNVPQPFARQDKSVMKLLVEGFQYAVSRQELLGSYLVDFVAMIFGMPMALFPAIAHAHGGAKTLGLLYSAPAVGALLISLVSGWTKQVKQHGKAIAIAAIFWGVSIIFFGLSTHLLWALFFLSLAGAADAVSGIFRQTLWNQTIPNEYRGRLSGIEMISYMSGPKLGDTEAGLVAAAFGVTASIVSGGVLCVIGVVTSCYFLSKFWQYKAE